MTDHSLPAFIRLIQTSTLLSEGEKEAYLDRPELLPESYRNRVSDILTGYEERNMIRYQRVQERADDVLDASVSAIEATNLPDDQKRELIRKIIAGRVQLT